MSVTNLIYNIPCSAGQERFRSLIPSYIRDSSVAIVVYDVTSKIFIWIENGLFIELAVYRWI